MSDYMSTYPIERIVRHGPDLISVYFKRLFDAVPGQFVNLWLPGVDEKPFSISNLTEESIEISVKAIGPFTQALLACRPDDYVGIRGPFGRGFDLKANALLVGGGIGLAPLRFLALALNAQGMEPVSIIGARSASDIIFAPKPVPGTVFFTTEDGSLGREGLVTKELEDYLTENTPSVIYSSGPEAMLVRIMEIADTADIPFQISFERYMKCGIGICGQCCLDGSGIRLCVEGPVLDQDAVRHVTEFGLPHRDATGRRRLDSG